MFSPLDTLRASSAAGTTKVSTRTAPRIPASRTDAPITRRRCGCLFVTAPPIRSPPHALHLTSTLQSSCAEDMSLSYGARPYFRKKLILLSVDHVEHKAAHFSGSAARRPLFYGQIALPVLHPRAFASNMLLAHSHHPLQIPFERSHSICPARCPRPPLPQ